MKTKIMILMAGLLLIGLNVFADDVQIDSSGNVKTGVASAGNLEVTGGSAEKAIVGQSSGSGGSGVYGINTTSGNYGYLGWDSFGVYGNSSSFGVYGISPAWAGYFQGNARVTGNLTVDGSITGALSETDPQVGTLTNGMWCTSNGILVNCATPAPITSEADPQVGVLTSSKWCTTDGAAVNCTSDAPSLSETDPQVGNNTTNYIPKWDGSALVTGTIYDDGNIGIGTTGSTDVKLLVSRTNDYGAGKASIYGFRPGTAGATNGGSSWSVSGVDAGIKAYTSWGNQFSSGLAGYSYLDYANSAAVVGAQWDGSYRGMLGYKDSSGGLWAGYFEGPVYFSNNLTLAGSVSGGLKILGGNVGIGTTTPTQQLQITRNFELPQTYSAEYGVIYQNGYRLIHSYGSNNFFAGGNAGNFDMSGEYNTGIGSLAFAGNSTGNNNTAIGSWALRMNDNGNDNTGVGKYALYSNTTASNNTAVGSYALYSSTTAGKNTAVGSYALYAQLGTWDSENTAIGFEALRNNQTGMSNTAVGSEALHENTNGSINTAIGWRALYKNTSGNYNTANGMHSLENNITGNDNTAFGDSALYSNTTGAYNTAIGYNADVASGNLTNATAIGKGATVDASNKVVIGNSSVTSIGGYASWSNFSDRRVKTDIEDIGYGLDLIKQLRPVSFKMKNGNGNTDFGFVAQDVEELLGNEYNVLDIGAGEERMLSIRYTQFIAPMVKAMQEQQEIIDSQQARIDSQQTQIDELKKIVEGLRAGR